jgi:hypothetical protein
MQVPRLHPFVLLLIRWRWLWSIGGILLNGENRSSRIETLFVPLRPPPVLHGMDRTRSLTFTMTSRRLTACAKARPPVGCDLYVRQREREREREREIVFLCLPSVVNERKSVFLSPVHVISFHWCHFAQAWVSNQLLVFHFCWLSRLPKGYVLINIHWLMKRGELALE